MTADLSPELIHIDGLVRSAARDFSYPATPRIAEAVQARIVAVPEHRPLLERLFGRAAARAAAAAALALLAVAGVSLAVPESRDALADLFGLSNVRVDRAPVTGPAPPVLNPNSFARLVTVAEAEEAAPFPLRFPTEGGSPLLPEATYLQHASASEIGVIFVYGDYDLWQTQNLAFGKGADPDLLHEIEFDGEPALWIEEGGHVAESYDASGRLLVETVRSVNRATLFWERDGVTYRLETSLSQAEAIEVARSLR